MLAFAPGQAYHRVVVEIINDSSPELDEQFSIQLLEPVDGAVLGTQSSLTITILTNDDAYGLVGFAEVSIMNAMARSNIDSYIIYLCIGY